MEDCCSPSNSSHTKTEEGKHHLKGGKTMKTENIVLWVIIAILAILTIYVLFFRGSVGTGNIASSAGQAVQSSGMVGGC